MVAITRSQTVTAATTEEVELFMYFVRCVNTPDYDIINECFPWLLDGL